MNIDLRIDRDISCTADSNGAYNIEFVATCDCGNKPKAIFPYGEPLLDVVCAKCGTRFKFTVTPEEIENED